MPTLPPLAVRPQRPALNPTRYIQRTDGPSVPSAKDDAAQLVAGIHAALAQGTAMYRADCALMLQLPENHIRVPRAIYYAMHQQWLDQALATRALAVRPTP